MVQKPGYPIRQRLYDWIAERNSPPKSKIPRKRFNNITDYSRHPPLQLKMETIYRCFVLGESVQLVSEEIGYSRSSIYTWRKKYNMIVLRNREKAVIVSDLKNKYSLPVPEFRILIFSTQTTIAHKLTTLKKCDKIYKIGDDET